jgi:hypothetical protein
VLRNAETNKSGQSKKMTHERKWHELITSGLGCTDHRFDEGAWQEQQIPRGLEKTPMSEFFQPRPRSSPDWLRSVMGKNRTTTWWSPKPANEIHPYIDSVLARHCLEHDDWHAGDTTWQGSLASSTSLMVTHKNFGDQCYFSLGEFCGSIVVGWPARKFNLKGSSFYAPNDVGEEDCGWSSWSFEWISPAHLKLLAGAAGAKHGLVARELTKPAPLLETAARACFWKLCKTAIGQLAKHLGVPVLHTSRSSGMSGRSSSVSRCLIGLPRLPATGHLIQVT